MVKLPDKEVSLLKPKGFKPTYPQLKSDIKVNTVIVGGGISGLTAAYLLTKAGQTVAVLEQVAIGSGTTGHTTGKVTSQHNLLYADLQNQFGKRAAKLYGQANEKAVEEIARVIKAEKIDCGWERADNYVYTADRDRVKQFKEEARIAAGLGLPASFETSTLLPFKVKAAVKFESQAHFNAQKYIEALAEAVNGSSSHIYEKTRAIGFLDGVPCRIKTPNGTVTADDVIVATNVPTFPLLARSTYCALEYPQNSYLVAGQPKFKLKGMYISPDKDHYSLLPVGSGKDQILLVGGENHIPGLGRAEPRHQKLADYAQAHFGVQKIDYRWHARDYLAYDMLPLIGLLYPWSKHFYVVTAFKKWGLSQSMVAANILRDLITGQQNELAEVFRPHRISPITSIPQTIARSFQ